MDSAFFMALTDLQLLLRVQRGISDSLACCIASERNIDHANYASIPIAG